MWVYTIYFVKLHLVTGGGRGLSPQLPLSRPNRTDAWWTLQKRTRLTFERLSSQFVCLHNCPSLFFARSNRFRLCAYAPLRVCACVPVCRCACAPLCLCACAPGRQCTFAPVRLCTCAPGRLCACAPTHQKQKIFEKCTFWLGEI